MEVIDQISADYPFDHEIKKWVDENFEWLHGIYTKPWGQPWWDDQEDFPNLYGDDSKSHLESAVLDLCAILEIDTIRVDYGIDSDLGGRVSGMSEGYCSTDCVLQIDETGAKKSYFITVPAEIQYNREYLLYKLILCFTQIVLEEDEIPYYQEDEPSDSINAFLHIAAVYFSFGLIIAKHGEQVGRDQYHSWNYPLSIPNPVLGYIIGRWSEKIDFEDSEWVSKLPERVRGTYIFYKQQFKQG